ncbi:hypothetical protein GCM10027360_50710 [Amycolatopsis echigonensis]
MEGQVGRELLGVVRDGGGVGEVVVAAVRLAVAHFEVGPGVLADVVVAAEPGEAGVPPGCGLVRHPGS